MLFFTGIFVGMFLFRAAPFHKAALRSDLVLNEDGKVVASYCNDIMFFVFSTIRDGQEDTTYFQVDEFSASVPIGKFLFDEGGNMKKSRMIVLAVVVLTFVFLGYKNTYQAKFYKNMYLNQQYTKTDDAFLDTNMLGDVIAFGKNEIVMIEIRDLEKLREEIKDKGGAPILQPGHYDTISWEYQNPKYNPFTKEITAEGLEESIKFIGKDRIEYKGKVFTIKDPAENTVGS